MESLEANPLGEDYRPSPHLTKGGMRLSANVNYNCVKSDEKRPTAPLEAQFCCPICQVATQSVANGCLALQNFSISDVVNHFAVSALLLSSESSEHGKRNP